MSAHWSQDWRRPVGTDRGVVYWFTLPSGEKSWQGMFRPPSAPPKPLVEADPRAS